eukprot:SAG31_NODE_1596_length_7800_cov_4.335801_4_plen_57_part_00
MRNLDARLRWSYMYIYTYELTYMYAIQLCHAAVYRTYATLLNLVRSMQSMHTKFIY